MLPENQLHCYSRLRFSGSGVRRGPRSHLQHAAHKPKSGKQVAYLVPESRIHRHGRSPRRYRRRLARRAAGCRRSTLACARRSIFFQSMPVSGMRGLCVGRGLRYFIVYPGADKTGYTVVCSVIDLRGH
jgi:hypothetical protein